MIGLLDPAFLGAAAYQAFPLPLGLEVRYSPISASYTNTGTTPANDGDLVEQAQNFGTNSTQLIETDSAKRPTKQIVGTTQAMQLVDNERRLMITPISFSSMEDFILSTAIDFSGGSGDYCLFGNSSTNVQFRFAGTTMLLVASGVTYWSGTIGSPLSGPHVCTMRVVAGIPYIYVDQSLQSGSFSGGYTSVPALAIDAIWMCPGGAGGAVGNAYTAGIKRGAVSDQQLAAWIARDADWMA